MYYISIVFSIGNSHFYIHHFYPSIYVETVISQILQVISENETNTDIHKHIDTDLMTTGSIVLYLRHCLAVATVPLDRLMARQS